MSYRLERVQSSQSSDFELAYAALEHEFAAQGELERPEVIARWLDENAGNAGAYAAPPATLSGLERRYHLFVARDARGSLAGVRDCHVLVDAGHAVVVVYLAHALVLEPYRRTGLGHRFRTLAVDLGREALARAAPGARAELLLAAEMEPLMLDDAASIVRLVAYGKDGFRAISPAALPYCQPDFRERRDEEGTTDPGGLPLLAVVRWVGHELRTSLPKRLARAFVEDLFAVFATHVDPLRLNRLAGHTLGVLDAFPLPEVPLLPLPHSVDDSASFAPLSESRVLAYFPEDLR